MKRVDWIIVALIGHSGCTGTVSESQISAILDSPSEISGGGVACEEYNLGPVLARGQTLRHEFHFTNDSVKRIRIIGAAAQTPCCSEVARLAGETVQPGQKLTIPVKLKIRSNQAERKRVEFVIDTDSKDRPVLKFALLANVCPDWEIQPVGEPTRDLPVGRGATDVLRVISRRVAGEGGVLPTEVEADPPLTARFRGEVSKLTGPDLLTTTSREVEIAIPSSRKTGSQQSTIRFKWPDGKTEKQSIFWQVTPWLSAGPSRLVLRPSEGIVPSTVVIRSYDGRLFRVTGVSSPGGTENTEFSRVPSVSQKLVFRLDPSRLSAEKETQIVIGTDHRDQPTVSVTVLVLPKGV